MRITLRIDALDPIRGSAQADGREGVAFTGWLGLLRVLSDTVTEQPGADGDADPGGER